MMVEGNTNKAGNKRGLYPRKPIKCPYCGRTFKGIQARNKHVNSKHADKSEQTNIKLADLATSGSTLVDMLKTITERLESSEPIVLPREFIDELRIQDAKLQLGVRIVAYKKLARIFKSLSQVEVLDGIIDDKLADTEMLKKTTTEYVMKLKAGVERQLTSDLDFLERVSGLTRGADDFVITKLIDALASVGRDLQLVRASTEGDIIPDDPRQREALRQKLTVCKSVINRTA